MKTAVEFLVKEFSDILGPLDIKPMQDLLLVDAIKRAKEMEKEQNEIYKYTEFDLISAFEYGWNQRHFDKTDEDELQQIQKRFIQSINETKTTRTMKVTTNEQGVIQLEEVFNGITLKTKNGEQISICMRDSGFEFEYQGKRYSAQQGVIEPVEITTPTLQEAQFLVNRFYEVQTNGENMDYDSAVECAKIAVDTIIKSDCLHMPEDRLYYKSVRKELEGLLNQA
jgi:hypothetical protein